MDKKLRFYNIKNIGKSLTDSALSGGGTILFPYFLFVIVIGLSGVIGEMSFGAGQSGRTGAYFHFPAQSVPDHAGKQYPNHVFFVAVLFAGISSLINLFEAPIAAMEQQFGLSRRISVSLIVALAFLSGICIQGIVADRMDYPSISAPWAPVLQALCSSGYMDGILCRVR